MTSNFADFDPDLPQDNLETEDLPPDCFELLSAYIDGELSLTEKQQVQTWLDEDPEVKAIYTQLMSLQGQMQHSVAPKSEKSVAEITTEVFQTLDLDLRRSRRRKLVWGGSAIAASVLAIISGIVPGTNPLGLRMAQTSSPKVNTSSVMLAVAVNKPAIDIPKAVEGYSFDSELEQN